MGTQLVTELPLARAGRLVVDPERAGGVVDLAATIRDAVGASAVLVAGRAPDGELYAAAHAGVPEVLLGELLDALASADDDGDDLGGDPLRELDLPGAAALGEAGLARVVCTALELDGTDVGMLAVLACKDDARVDRALIVPFARLAAVGIAQVRRPARRQLLEQALEANDAFDRFALTASDVEELTHGIAATLAEILDVPLTALMIYDDGRELLQMAPGSFGADDERVSSYQISVADPHSNAARVFATGQPYLSNDAAADPGIRPGYVRAFGIRRLLSVPLRMGTRRIGVLHLANKEDDFTLDDLVRAEALAPRVATLVALTGASFRLRREQCLERVLSGLALAIASGEGLRALLPPTFDALCAATDASLLALVPTDGRPIVVRRGPTNPALEHRVLAAAAEQPAERADIARPGSVGDPGWSAFHEPVTLGTARVGTLSALRARSEPFAPDEQRALRRVAQLAALTWATESYQQEGAQLARLQERQQISAELHDDVQALLVQAQARLDQTLGHPGLEPALAATVVHARRLVIRSTTALHSVAQRFSRPASCDLSLRLRTVISGIEQEFLLPVRLRATPDASRAGRELPRSLADVMVKVAREALVNAAKHGGRCFAEVGLEVDGDGRLLLTVVDDGVGLCASDGQPRHGLTSLRRTIAEQGVRLEVGPGPEGGTRVAAGVLLPA